MTPKNIYEHDGYLFVAGIRRDKQAPVYIGWAPSDGHSVGLRMKQLRQDNPGVHVMEFCRATEDEVRAMRTDLASSWLGHSEWFRRTPDLDELLTAIRDLYADERDEAEAA